VGGDAAGAALSAERVPVIEFRANTQNFSEPTKELDAAMRAQRTENDGNPVLEWCARKVLGRYDARSKVSPRARPRPEQKIDANSALIISIALNGGAAGAQCTKRKGWSL
jgi:phage terminase large subunit-like protein